MKELSIDEKSRRYDEESERIRMINFISNELACIRSTDEKGSDRYDELTDAIDWLENLSQIKHLTTIKNKVLWQR